MLVYDKQAKTTQAIDYREIAPEQLKRSDFILADSQVDQQAIKFSLKAAGVPGTVAGLLAAHQRYGRLPLKTLLQPAIDLARHGFIISPSLASSIAARQERLSRYSASRQVFFDQEGRPLAAGALLKQPDLASTLQLIAEQGQKVFYQGDIAKKIVAAMREHGGVMRLSDLADYQVKIRAPLKKTFHGYELHVMPPPSSGGVHLLQMLGVLEQLELASLGHNSADYIHLLTETMRVAYADRSRYLGDPDFVDVPVDKLISTAYLNTIAENINRSKATPSSQIKPGIYLDNESPQTTHYSIVDPEGNVVSNTYTLNFSFGSGIMIPGTGILMNNELDDFSIKPGEPNAFGLLGGKANALEGGKRPLSSMVPVIIFNEDRPFLVTGSPGGSRIISTLLQLVLNRTIFDFNLATATALPRIHHQWYPDELMHEQGISVDTQKLLQAKGHQLKQTRSMGATQSIEVASDHLLGAADLRRPGAECVGY